MDNQEASCIIFVLIGLATLGAMSAGGEKERVTEVTKRYSIGTVISIICHFK